MIGVKPLVYNGSSSYEFCSGIIMSRASDSINPNLSFSFLKEHLCEKCNVQTVSVMEICSVIIGRE